MKLTGWMKTAFAGVLSSAVKTGFEESEKDRLAREAVSGNHARVDRG
jgi:hypothetical protein